MPFDGTDGHPVDQTTTSTCTPNGSSDLAFTSSDSNNPSSLPFQRTGSPSKSSFQWPSEPLNDGRRSLPQHSQQSIEDANRDISQRITQANHDATTHPQSSPIPRLDQPRLSVQLSATLNILEDERKEQLSPTNTSLPILSPQPQNMNRSSSNGTNKLTTSDRPDAPPPTSQYPGFLPDMFRNAASMPLNLLRSLIPDNAFPASTDESLSASTLQVPVTSFNALFEACKALEWLATQASQLDLPDKATTTRRNSSTAPNQSEDNVDFSQFDYLQLLQKVADVVSGLAAAKGIDLVLDLDPQLQGPPANNQRHYKLGSCTVWADRLALTFLFMSCISRLLHNAPVQSIVIITSTLTPKDDSVLPIDLDPQMKLMILSLGLRLVLPRTRAATQDLMSSISGTPASLLLDAFGARLTTEQSTTLLSGNPLPGIPDRAVIDHSISVPVGQLAEAQQPASQEPEFESSLSKASKHIAGPDQDELVHFASTLQSNKVALYSTSQSVFARQLFTFLSGLGCDVAPVLTDSVDESSFEGSDHIFGKSTHTAVALTAGRPALVSYTSDIDQRAHPVSTSTSDKTTSATQIRQDGLPASTADTAVLDPVIGVPVTFDNSSYQSPIADQTPGSSHQVSDQAQLTPQTQVDQVGRRVVPFNFVIIDDDIATLQKELLRIRSAVPLLKSALGSKSSPNNPAATHQKMPRPTLDHRTKSSPQVNRLMASQPDLVSPRSFGSLGSALMHSESGTESLDSMDEAVSQTIIFFTSMKSYRLVRDTVQPIIDSASFRGVSSPPEIMVLPKPAGAKRILTALYVAQHKPVVRLPFLPIATSPLSPLVSHSKSWWTSDSSQQQDDHGFMTLTRRETASADADFDTTPPTPWSPVDAFKAAEQIATPDIPLADENMPSTGEPALKGTSVRTITKETGPGAAPSTAASITKSTSRSTASRHQNGSKPNANPADAILTHRGSHAGPAPASTASLSASVHQARSQPVVSPMPAEALEYFSETAAKMGGSAASGMVIQSPDGRPAGIFFQPKASLSTPSLSGSKPALSRGVSASSLRRSHQVSSEHSDRSESAHRDRRMSNRSTDSTGGSIRGSGADGQQSRASNLHTLTEQAASGIAAEHGDLRVTQLPLPGANKYPTGSIFAPQVGIHSVLNSSRPPMTTPLAPSLSSPIQDSSEGGAEGQVSAAHESSQRGDGGKQADSHTDANVAVSSTGERLEKANSGVDSDSAKVDEAARSSGARPRQPVASAKNSAIASPNARTSAIGASRVAARQSLNASVTASPSDSKNKPSAVPQSGFMMGMGFTASARRGRGPKKAPVREAVLPPIKVLIVEDNPINQRILSMFMGKKKIKYDVANNGREAVEKWKTGGYHLILMDIQLPVMDGIEATKEIRKLERSANIGILPNTPPAGAESRMEVPSSSLSGGSRTLTAKGLMKHAVAGCGNVGAPEGDKRLPSKQPGPKVSSTIGGSNASCSELVSGLGIADRVSTNIRGASGSINAFRASVIIVALTASVLSSDRVEALAAGCNDFLNKPVSLPWLNQKILEWGSMMYLMYSGLSSDDIHLDKQSGGGVGGASKTDRAQLHLGFGYGPAEKAKALANNLHLGDTLAAKKKKRSEQRERIEASREKREHVVAKSAQQKGSALADDAARRVESTGKLDARI